MSLFNQTTGQGPDIVLLHGWGMNSDVWQDCVTNLSQSFRTTVVDLPGHGRSKDEITDYSLKYLARQVIDVMPERCVLVGWSLGGLVAIQIALDYPDKLNKLILVASSPQFVKDDTWPEGMDPDVLNSFAGDLQEDYRKTVNRFIAIQAMGSDNPREEQRILRERVFRHGHPQLPALAGGLELLHNTNLRPRLPEVKCPTLLLAGENDTLFRPKAAERATLLLKNSKLRIIKGAGHAPFLSHEKEFLQELRLFVND